MNRFLSTVAATALVVLGLSAVADAGHSASTTRPASTPAVVVTSVLGPETPVPPGAFVKAFAHCPRGYVVTGGGAYNGAITEVASGPTSDKRAWFVDGTNNDPQKRTFDHAADAVCMKGGSALSVKTATASAASVRQAERDFLLTRGGVPGR
jgi:hypothetical protein